MRIPFNKPHLTGNEFAYVRQAVEAGHLSGDGQFTRRCQALLQEQIGAHRALLTHSCTAALEMTALLLDLQPGDEVILPSYTFVSTASAFVLRGAVPVFVDIRADTLNLDETLIERAITPRTKAIVVVHYAGVACEMDAILAIAKRHGLAVIEDAAHAMLASYKGQPLGSLGDFATLSFHETKNVISGEGGALLINQADQLKRAEIIWEKGTNRSAFFRGEVDKYTWVDVGSSFLPSEIVAAVLLAQLEQARRLTELRLGIWRRYHEAFAELERAGLVRRPVVPSNCGHNAHLYYLLFPDLRSRSAAIAAFRARGIHTVFHYVPLHSSPAGRRFGRVAGDDPAASLPVTDRVADCLLRLPLWIDLLQAPADRVDPLPPGAEGLPGALPARSEEVTLARIAKRQDEIDDRVAEVIEVVGSVLRSTATASLALVRRDPRGLGSRGIFPRSITNPSHGEHVSMSEKKPGAGLEDVVAGESSICFIDGLQGILRYRGYPAQDLATKCSFEETLYLLWNGELPNKAQLDELRALLAENATPPAEAFAVMRTLPKDIHPMAALRTAMSVAGHADPDAEASAKDPAAGRRSAARLQAWIVGIVAGWDRIRRGKEPIPAKAGLSLAGQLLYQLHGEVPSPAAEKTMDECLTLHADHELNASTFTGRVAAATLTDIWSACIGAIGALKGPLHGGANTDVMNMLLEIHETGKGAAGADEWVRNALANKRKISGFGHRVYRAPDPRATRLKVLSKKMADDTGVQTWYELSLAVEKAFHDQKNLPANVDFFSASTYYVMNIAPDMYTPIFAVSRMSGWTAHILEQYANNRLIRPRADYIGPDAREVSSIEARLSSHDGCSAVAGDRLEICRNTPSGVACPPHRRRAFALARVLGHRRLEPRAVQDEPRLPNPEQS
jgi:dTDP-4-amino-4,6-dideoxygalactose transaminase